MQLLKCEQEILQVLLPTLKKLHVCTLQNLAMYRGSVSTFADLSVALGATPCYVQRAHFWCLKLAYFLETQWGPPLYVISDLDWQIWPLRSWGIRCWKSPVTSSAAYCPQLRTQWFFSSCIHERKCSSQGSCWPVEWSVASYTKDVWRLIGRIEEGKGEAYATKIDVRCSDRNRIIAYKSVLIATGGSATAEMAMRYSSFSQWISRAWLAFIDESQLYGNYHEIAALAAIQQAALTVFIGDHRQTPGGLSKGRAAAANQRKLLQRPLGLRALNRPGDYLPPVRMAALIALLWPDASQDDESDIASVSPTAAHGLLLHKTMNCQSPLGDCSAAEHYASLTYTAASLQRPLLSYWSYWLQQHRKSLEFLSVQLPSKRQD